MNSYIFSILVVLAILPLPTCFLYHFELVTSTRSINRSEIASCRCLDGYKGVWVHTLQQDSLDLYEKTQREIFAINGYSNEIAMEYRQEITRYHAEGYKLIDTLQIDFFLWNTGCDLKYITVQPLSKDTIIHKDIIVSLLCIGDTLNVNIKQQELLVSSQRWIKSDTAKSLYFEVLRDGEWRKSDLLIKED